MVLYAVSNNQSSNSKVIFATVEKTVNLQENVNPDLLNSMKTGFPSKLDGVPGRQVQENDAIPKIAPKWLKYDR